MSDYVIIVPKQDELIAVEWGFETRLDRPDERTRSGVELFRREFPFGGVTFALLDKQTNTYSSILTADVITRETPSLVFLTGTALGHRGRVPIGSVLVSDGVIDISEKRYSADGGQSYVTRGPTKSDELTLDAKEFISRRFGQERAHVHLRSMARRPVLLRGTRRIADFIVQHDPTVLCEPIVSGNEYRMGGTTEQADPMWTQVPTARAYDMEAAGFALAALISTVPWLVVRGVSDHGTPETKSDYNRTLAAGLAGRFLFEFLCNGLVRAARLPIFQETTTTIPLLRDEAYRLDGAWEGAMAYLDDEGVPVIFSEHAEFVQEGSNVQGIIKSQRIAGGSRHATLEYRVSFSIARHGYAGGVWSETMATRRYFGVMMGGFDEDSTVLAGTWLGTHKNGVRRGYFRWYNTRRDGEHRAVRLDLSETIEDLVSSFSESRLRSYNDACKVAP